MTGRSCLPFRRRPCLRCWRKVSDQRKKTLEEEKDFVKFSFPSWSCCFAPVAETTATLGMRAFWWGQVQWPCCNPAPVQIWVVFIWDLPLLPLKDFWERRWFSFFSFSAFPVSLAFFHSVFFVMMTAQIFQFVMLQSNGKKTQGEKSNAHGDQVHSYHKKWLSASYVPGT